MTSGCRFREIQVAAGHAGAVHLVAVCLAVGRAGGFAGSRPDWRWQVLGQQVHCRRAPYLRDVDPLQSGPAESLPVRCAVGIADCAAAIPAGDVAAAVGCQMTAAHLEVDVHLEGAVAVGVRVAGPEAVARETPPRRLAALMPHAQRMVAAAVADPVVGFRMDVGGDVVDYRFASRPRRLHLQRAGCCSCLMIDCRPIKVLLKCHMTAIGTEQNRHSARRNVRMPHMAVHVECQARHVTCAVC